MNLSKNEIYSTISNLKKVELHRHIEGCITPSFMRNLVEKHDPSSHYLESGMIERLYQYTDFNGFLNAFGIVLSFLRKLDDFKLLAREVISQLKSDNVIYSELIFSGQNYVKEGLDLEKILETMHEEFSKANVRTHLILDIVRHWGVREAEIYIDSVIKILKQNPTLRDWVVAISIGGDEVKFPAYLFEQPFANARQAGLQTYAHAGEWDAAKSVWDALNLLKIKRIGHGIRSIEDPELILYLTANNIMLDISITSNYITQALHKGENHPVVELNKNGVKFSLNTDDPGFFNTDLNQEYMKAYNLGINQDSLKEISKHAVESAMIPENEKDKVRELL